MNYRLYLADDFPQLYAIEEVCFQRPLRFGRQYMRELVDSAASATWIAEEGEMMTGFAIVEWSGETAERFAYIQTLEVAPQNRRGGIGAELLRRLEESALLAGAQGIWLHVDAENAPAIRLYRAHGYVQEGRREHYYGRGRAAHIYLKSLSAGEGDGSLAGSP